MKYKLNLMFKQLGERVARVFAVVGGQGNVFVIS